MFKSLFCTALLLLAVEKVARAQSTDLPHQLAKTSVDANRPDQVLAAFLNNPAIDDSFRQDLKKDAALLRSTNWEAAVPKLAGIYSKQLNEAEQQSLATFLATTAGKKFLSVQAEALSQLMVHAIVSKQQTRARQSFESVLKSTIAAASPAARAEIERALRAKPLLRKDLLGKWYTQDDQEESFAFTGRHSKDADGSNISAGVSLDHEAKTYERFIDRGIWEIRGRLVIEMNFSDLEWVNLFIIDKLSTNELVWRIVDTEAPLNEWILSKETRTPIALPTRPSGYEDLSP